MKTYDTEALKLVENILEEQITALSEEDLTLLSEHKEICLKKILPILALEVTQIQNDEEWNPSKLHWSLKLASFFKEPKAFPWICQLHRHADAIHQQLGSVFINLYWPSILALTADSEWEKLKDEIEDPSIDEEMRKSCLEALPLLVANNLLDRSFVVDYFQSLYKKILSGEIEDSIFIVDLVDASIALWPGEFLEDIRELYGLDFINDNQIELSCILETYNDGLQETQKELKEWISSCHPLEPLIPNRIFEEKAFEDLSQELSEAEEHFNYVWEPYSLANSQEVAELGGLVRFSLSKTSEGDPVEIGNITEGYIPEPLIDSMPNKDKKKYFSLCPLSQHRPEKAAEIAIDLLERHSEIPSLYYYLYISYKMLDMRQQAMDVLKQLVKKFPNYLFGQIAYANYLLKKAEPEKMASFFSHAFTLSGLHPKREAFYVAEWVKFVHVVGWYFLQIGIIEQAEAHLDTLKQIAPTSEEFCDLEARIQNSLFQSSLDDDLLNFD